MPDPIDALPTPPSRSDAPATFISRANAFIAALVNFVTQTNAVATAMNLNATSGTSASSNSIGTGAKTFTADTGKSWLPGMFIVIADTAAPSTNSMLAQVTSYDTGTGALVVDVKSKLGSGTKTAWTISQTANPVPLDGSVSTSSLQDGLLTSDTTGRAKMADKYVTPVKLSDDAFIDIQGDSRGLVITNNSGTPNSQVDIDADEIILKDSSGRAYLAQSVNLTANIAASGANGLDTGAEANSTWYYLWVIYNGTTVAALLSTSSTAPTLPSGYTYKAIVGAIYNKSSGDFILIRQLGNKVRYEEQRTIIDGALTALAWTAVSVTAFFPPTAKELLITGAEQFGISHRSDGFGGHYFFSPNASTARSFSVLPTARNAMNTGKCLYNSSIYYFMVTSPGTLMATGWEY